MSSRPGRFGESNEKRQEAFVQHNGLVVGNLKYLMWWFTHSIMGVIVIVLVGLLVAALLFGVI